MGTELTEAHTGYRAYSRHLLLTRSVPAQLRRLQLRLRDAHAVGALRDAAARGARARAATSTMRPRWACAAAIIYGVKTLWIGVRLMLHRSADRALEQVQVPGRQRRREVEPRGHRRAGGDPGGGLQPDLAAPRGGLRAVRAVPGAGPGGRRGLRGRPQLRAAGAAGDGGRGPRPGGAGRARTARPWRPTCAACRSPTAASTARSPCTRSSTCPTPARALAELERVHQGRRRVGAGDPQPPDLRAGGRDHRPLPLHRVLAAGVRGACARGVRLGRAAGHLRLGALPRAGGGRARQAGPRCWRETRCGCGDWCPAGCVSACTTGA